MRATVHLHSNQERMYNLGVKLGLTGHALDFFRYACYEVELTIEVNPDTGAATIVEVDKRKIEA